MLSIQTHPQPWIFPILYCLVFLDNVLNSGGGAVPSLAWFPAPPIEVEHEGCFLMAMSVAITPRTSGQLPVLGCSLFNVQEQEGVTDQ